MVADQTFQNLQLLTLANIFLQCRTHSLFLGLVITHAAGFIDQPVVDCQLVATAHLFFV